MKVLLYFENEDSIKKSGIGRALKHQLQACKDAGVETTTDKNSSFDIAHINTLGSMEGSAKCIARRILSSPRPHIAKA